MRNLPEAFFVAKYQISGKKTIISGCTGLLITDFIISGSNRKCVGGSKICGLQLHIYHSKS